MYLKLLVGDASADRFWMNSLSAVATIVIVYIISVYSTYFQFVPHHPPWRHIALLDEGNVAYVCRLFAGAKYVVVLRLVDLLFQRVVVAIDYGVI